MPLYQFHCLSCQNTFELLRSIAARDASAKCSRCHSEQTKRAFAPFATVRSDTTQQAEAQPNHESVGIKIVNSSGTMTRVSVRGYDKGITVEGDSRVTGTDVTLSENTVGVDVDGDSEVKLRRVRID